MIFLEYLNSRTLSQNRTSFCIYITKHENVRALFTMTLIITPVVSIKFILWRPNLVKCWSHPDSLGMDIVVSKVPSLTFCVSELFHFYVSRGERANGDHLLVIPPFSPTFWSEWIPCHLLPFSHVQISFVKDSSRTKRKSNSTEFLSLVQEDSEEKALL